VKKKIASDIKLAFYSSNITIMHCPINIRFSKNIFEKFLNIYHKIYHKTSPFNRRCKISNTFDTI